MNKCKYCGGEAKYQFKNGAWCCSKVFYKCPGHRKSLSESAKSNWSQLKSKGYNVKADIPTEERRTQKTDYDGSVCAWCGRPAIKVLKNGKGCCSEFLAQCPALKEKNSQSNKKNYEKTRSSWNKGLTKEQNPSLMKMSDKMKKLWADGRFDNVNHRSFLGRTLTEEHKKAISESMKKAHAEGRAHNIGNCRWNNEPSYPEQFFIEVIKNEFNDKNYEREYPFFGFSLDFAWPEKKKCIEIDGEQHTRFKDYAERDERKNKTLIDNGWKYLRIVWKEMFKDTKKWIEIAKDFIEK